MHFYKAIHTSNNPFFTNVNIQKRFSTQAAQGTETMHTIYVLRPLYPLIRENTAKFERLQKEYPDILPKLKHYYAISKQAADGTFIELRCHHEYVLFCPKDGRIGISTFNIETSLTLDSTPEELYAEVQRYCALEYKTYAMAAYRHLIQRHGASRFLLTKEDVINFG